MSYCAIITFKDGKPDQQIEFRNAWGGAARIWDALFDKYLKDPAIPYHSWLCRNQQPLWDLAKRKSLPMFERAIHCSTFDLAYIRRENFPRFCNDLNAFEAAYPTPVKVNHLPSWEARIEDLDCEAISFYGTSVAENLWCKWDSEKDEPIEVPLSEGWEIYDWLDQPETETP